MEGSAPEIVRETSNESIESVHRAWRLSKYINRLPNYARKAVIIGILGTTLTACGDKNANDTPSSGYQDSQTTEESNGFFESLGENVDSGVDSVQNFANDAYENRDSVIEPVQETGNDVIDQGQETGSEGQELVDQTIDEGGNVIQTVVENAGEMIDSVSDPDSQPTELLPTEEPTPTVELLPSETPTQESSLPPTEAKTPTPIPEIPTEVPPTPTSVPPTPTTEPTQVPTEEPEEPTSTNSPETTEDTDSPQNSESVSELGETNEEIIESLVELCNNVYPDNVVMAELACSQAILESGILDGGSTLANTYNNFFGMKGKGTAGSVMLMTTEQDADGNEYQTEAEFAVFTTVEESFQAHRLLMNWDNYAPVWEAETFEEAANMIANPDVISRPYATDIHYAEKIINRYNEYLKTHFESKEETPTPEPTDVPTEVPTNTPTPEPTETPTPTTEPTSPPTETSEAETSTPSIEEELNRVHADRDTMENLTNASVAIVDELDESEYEYGWCLMGVQRTLMAVGLPVYDENPDGSLLRDENGDPEVPHSAYLMAELLEGDPRFAEITVSPDELNSLPPGVIVVWERDPSTTADDSLDNAGNTTAEHGHIEISWGDGVFASSFKNDGSELGYVLRLQSPYRVFVPVESENNAAGPAETTSQTEVTPQTSEQDEMQISYENLTETEDGLGYEAPEYFETAEEYEQAIEKEFGVYLQEFDKDHLEWTWELLWNTRKTNFDELIFEAIIHAEGGDGAGSSQVNCARDNETDVYIGQYSNKETFKAILTHELGHFIICSDYMEDKFTTYYQDNILSTEGAVSFYGAYAPQINNGKSYHENFADAVMYYLNPEFTGISLHPGEATVNSIMANNPEAEELWHQNGSNPFYDMENHPKTRQLMEDILWGNLAVTNPTHT